MRYALIIPVFLLLFSCTAGNRYNQYSLSQIYQVDSLEYLGVNLVPEMYSTGYLILEDGYITLDLKATEETINKTKEYYGSTKLFLEISEIGLMQEFTYIQRKEGYILSQNITNYKVSGKNTQRIEDLLNYEIKSKKDKNNTGIVNLIGKNLEDNTQPIIFLDIPPKTLVKLTSSDPIIIEADDFKLQLTYFTKYKYIP